MMRYEARNLLDTMRHLLDPSKIPLIEAFGRGEEIQILHGSTWDDGGDDVSFTCAAKLYRIKPKPQELWAIFRKNGSRHSTHESELTASNLLNRLNNECDLVIEEYRPYTLKKFVEEVCK
jgi:hypothetical protein